MRLTLRTLLAYLDDRLAPAHTKEIGKKVAESSFATTLINRIREVMRRRRLTAPELSGPSAKIDPNSVSEYLDNMLSPEEVRDIEKVCLESDMHLAEVAASHQILTLMLSEPVDIPPQRRERMYALGPVVTASEPKVLEPLKEATAEMMNGVGNSTKHPVVQGKDEAFDRTIPEYLRPKPSFRRALPYLIVTVAALVWIALVAIDPTLYPQLFGPDEEQQLGLENEERNAVSDVPRIDVAATPKTQGDSDGNPTLIASNSAGGTTDSSIVPSGSGTINVDPPPPKDVPDSLPREPASQPPKKAPLLPDKTTTPKEPEPKPKSVAKTDDKEPQRKEGDLKPGAQANVNPPEAPPIEYASESGILLRYSAEKKDWMVVASHALIETGDVIASPEPFQAALKVGPELFQVSLLAGTNLQVMPATETAVIGFRVTQGRVILSAPAGAANDDQSVVIGIDLHGETCHLELVGGDALCGIEVFRREPEQLDHDFGEDRFTGALYVIKGSVRFTDGSGAAQVIGSKDWLPLTPEDRKKAIDPKNPAPRPPLLEVPEWLDSNRKRSSITQRRYASQFEKEFDVAQPLLFSIPAVISAPRPAISELAVKCLAVTDSYAALVQALERAEHEEARIAAIRGLRAWLPTSPDNKDLLMAELNKRFHPDTAQTIYLLTWGYSAKDLTLTTPAPTPSDDLIRWLQHEDIEVREMAFYHVYRLTGKKYDYRPNSSAGQRQSAVRRWQSQLNRDESLLKE